MNLFQRFLLLLFCLLSSFETQGKISIYYPNSKNACFLCDDSIKNKTRDLLKQKLQEGETDFILKFITNNQDNHNFTTEMIKQLDAALKEYDKQFDKIMDVLDDKRGAVETLSQQDKFQNLLQKNIAAFFNVQLQDFYAFVYIVSNLKTPFHINSTLFIASSDLPTNLFLGSIFRYVCEIFFDYGKEKNNIPIWFRISGKRRSAEASAIFKKVIAFSVARWLLWELGEKNVLESGSRVLDEISLQMADLVTEYLSKGASMDQNFINQYLDRFVMIFPCPHLMPEIIFSNSVLITTEPKGDVEAAPYSFSCLQEEFGTERWSSCHATGDCFSPVFVLKKGQGDMQIQVDATGRVFIYINSLDKEKISKAIKILKKQRELQNGFNEKL